MTVNRGVAKNLLSGQQGWSGGRSRRHMLNIWLKSLNTYKYNTTKISAVLVLNYACIKKVGVLQNVCYHCKYLTFVLIDKFLLQVSRDGLIELPIEHSNFNFYKHVIPQILTNPLLSSVPLYFEKIPATPGDMHPPLLCHWGLNILCSLLSLRKHVL